MGLSFRHIHLCQSHLDILFGEGHALTPFKDLYQPGYYAAHERLLVLGKRRCIEDVRVLGPLRPHSQVELSQTDAVSLGMHLAVAETGTDAASAPVLLVGPRGQVQLPGGSGGGAYIARRHLHLDPAEAERLGLREGALVDVCTPGPRSITFHGVLVRTKAGWLPEVHLDADEANAAGIHNAQMVTVVMP
jgi:putative phosphotransacetylase